MTNPDIRVAAYRLGVERRTKGLPRWAQRINIKQFLSQDDADENAIAVGEKIAALLRSKLTKRLDLKTEEYDEEIDLIIENLERDVGPAGDGCCCERLNELLDQLYDWADLNAIWLG